MGKQRHKAKSAAAPQEPEASAGFQIERWLPLVLALLVAAVYANGLSGPFVFDDINLIQHNPRAQEFWKVTEYSNSERPVLFFTLALNYQIGQTNPLGYKLFNLAVHIAAALALMGLVRRTLLLPRFGEAFRDSAAGLGFAVAVLWAVHPLTTEAVTYVVHRGESMMGLCALVLFYCTVRGAQSQTSWPWYLTAGAAGFLGFGCKQWMVAVPVVLLLYDRIMLGGSWREWGLRRGAIYAVLLIPTAWLLILHRHDLSNRLEWSRASAAVAPEHLNGLLASAASELPTPSASATTAGTTETKGTSETVESTEFELGTPRRYSSLEYLRTQPEVVTHYLRLAAWPYPLCVDYFWRKADTRERIVPPAIFLVLLMIATCLALWRYPPWGFLGAAFFLLLAPSSSIAAIEDMAAERRMYLPLTALAALAVMAVWTVLGKLMARSVEGTAPEAEHRRRFVGSMLLMVAVAVFGGLTVLRNFDYTKDAALWERVIELVPYNARARVNVARALIMDADMARDPAERAAGYILALEHLQVAEKHSPKGAYVHSQIGHIRAQQADLQQQQGRAGWEGRRLRLMEDAERRFRKAVELEPSNVLFHLNLAVVLEQKETQSAKDESFLNYQQAVDLGRQSFRLPGAHHGLARALHERGRLAEAIVQYQEALRLEPALISAQTQLASALASQGSVSEAIAVAENALERVQRMQGQQQLAADIQKQIEQLRATGKP